MNSDSTVEPSRNRFKIFERFHLEVSLYEVNETLIDKKKKIEILFLNLLDGLLH